MNIPKGILKITEWESASGRWYAADTTGFSGWWVIARMLEMKLGEYARFLVNEYNAIIDDFIIYPYEDKRNSLLIFHFNSYQDAHKFVLFVNREARKRKFFV